MDDVRNWLKGIRLDEYANKFNEQGWDDISIVKTMSTDDIKTCVSKPGHVKKIEIAIQHLNKENHQEMCQNPSETDTNVPSAQSCIGRGERDLSGVSEAEEFSYQSDTPSRDRTCYEFTAANSNLKNSRTKIANITRLDITYQEISQPDIQKNIQPYLHPEITPPDIQPYIEPNIQRDITPSEMTSPDMHPDITPPEITSTDMHPDITPPEITPPDMHPDITPPEITSSDMHPDITPPEITSTDMHPDITPPEITSSDMHPDITPPEITSTDMHPDITPPEITSSDMHPDITPPEMTSPDMHPDITPPEITSTDMHPDITPPEMTSTDMHPDITPPEMTSTDMHPDITPPEMTSTDMHPDITPPEITSTDMHPDITPPEMTSSDMHPDITPPEMTSPDMHPDITPSEMTSPDMHPDITPPEMTPQDMHPDITPPEMPDITPTEMTSPDMHSDITQPEMTSPDITPPEMTPPDMHPDITPPEMITPDMHPDITSPVITQIGAVTVRNINSQSEDEATSSEDDCNDTRRTFISPTSLTVARGRQLIAAEASMAIASSTIVKNSKNITIAKKVEVHNIHQRDSRYDNFTAQTQTAVDNYQNKKPLFVKTQAYKDVVDVLDDRYWAVVVGNPGDGKSTLANQLMCEHLDNDYDPVIVTSPEDWKTMVEGKGKESHKQFVIIDNMFGVMSTDERKLNEWMSLLDLMEKVVHERKGDLKVICTTRKHIWSEVSNRVSRFQVFGKLSVVDFTSHPLSNDEKIKMLNRYYTYYKLEKDDELLFLIKELKETSHGFPHCVEIFSTNSIIREKGILFFENPLGCVEKEMKHFLSEDKTKMCALIFTLLSEKNTFEIDALHSDEIQTSFEYKKSLSLSGLPVHTETSVIADAVEHLNTVYLREISDRVFTFKHNSFKEILSIVLSKRYPTRMIELLDIQFIVAKVKYYGYKPSIKETVVVLPNSRSVVNALRCRITKEIIKGNADQICKHQAWDDESFISQWLSNVETEKSKMGIEETLLIECLSVNSSVELAHNSGLLPMLAYSRKEKAVSSVLVCPQLSKYWQTERGNLQVSIALVYACYRDFSTNVLNMLIEHGAYMETTLELGEYFRNYYTLTAIYSFVYTHIVDIIADDYCSPLTCSVFRGNVENTRLLLDKGASVFRFSSQGKSIVFLAAEGCSPNVLRCILDHIDSLELKPAANEKNECSKVDHLYGAKYASFFCNVRANIDPFHERVIGSNNVYAAELCPIHITNNVEILDMLYTRGASANQYVEILEYKIPDIIYRAHINSLSNTVIDTMARHGTHIDVEYEQENVLHSIFQDAYYDDLSSIVTAVLKHGADKNFQDSLGRTPLIRLMSSEHYADLMHGETVNLLIDKGADVNLCDEMGYVPLFYALKSMENLEIILKLIKLTDVNRISKDGRNCFHFLAEQSVCDNSQERMQTCIKQMLDKGADINCRDNDGYCPLSIACIDMMDIFIENGAQLASLDSKGRDIVMKLLCMKSESICQKIDILLEYKINISRSDHTNRNAMHYLVMAEYDDSVKMMVLDILLKEQCDINAGDEHQTTPLMLALESGKCGKDFITRLIEKGASDTHVDEWENSIFWYLFRSTAKESIIVELYDMLKPFTTNSNDLTSLKMRPASCISVVKHIFESQRTDASKSVLLDVILGGTVCRDVIEDIRRDHDISKCILCLPLCIETLGRSGVDIRSMFVDGIDTLNLPEADDEIIHVFGTLMKHGVNIAERLFVSNSHSPVIQFAKDGKLKALEHLLDSGYRDIDLHLQTDYEGNTILHILFSTNHNDEKVLSVIGKINFQLIANAKNKQGVTPLLLACQQTQLKPKCISLLISHGADVNFTDSNGMSAIHYLVEKADYALSSTDTIYQVVYLLVDLLDKQAILDIQDNEGRTPLMRLLMCSRCCEFVDVIEFLIVNAKRLDQRDNNGRTALDFCVTSSLDNEALSMFVQELHRRGVPPGEMFAVTKYTALSSTIIDKNKILTTLFQHISTCENEAQECDVFSDCVTDADIHVNGDTDVTGVTLLAQSCRFFRDDLVEGLLGRGADPNVPDVMGYTSLHRLLFSNVLCYSSVMTAACFEKSIISEVIFQGSYSFPWESALEVACNEFESDESTSISTKKTKGYLRDKIRFKGMFDAMPISFLKSMVGIQEQHLDVKVKHYFGVLKCFNTGIKILNMLLKHHADPNQMDIFGKSPLHYCVESPVIDGFTCPAMEMLIAHGADVNLEDYEGKTPLMLCAQHARTKYRRMNILIEAGADLYAVDYSGRSVADYTQIGIGTMIWNKQTVDFVIEENPSVSNLALKKPKKHVKTSDFMDMIKDIRRI